LGGGIILMARSQIIKDLANSSCDLSTSLKRARVLIQLLGDTEMLKWIDLEMIGYTSNNDIPEYRKMVGVLIGTYLEGIPSNCIQYSNVSISLGAMPTEEKQKLLTCYIKQGIIALEKMLENPETNFAKAVTAEIYPFISKFNNNPYMKIVSANVNIDKMQVMNIIPIVTNKLMDILLLLEKEFGNLDELDIDVDNKTEDELKKIHNEMIGIIYVDNRVIIGDNNKIKDSTIASSIE
jgi:hypothetical protein